MSKAYAICGDNMCYREVYTKEEEECSRPVYYNTVVSMKSDANLTNGMKAVTLGYYELNDGGGATYIIRTKESGDVEDNGTIHLLQNNLVAELIIENNIVNIKQLGARPQDKQNNKYDIAPYVEKYINYIETNDSNCKLYIPSGIWTSSELNITRYKGFYIEGDEKFSINNKEMGTTITALNNEQRYIFKIGNETNAVEGWVLKNVCFASRNYVYSNGTFNRDTYNNITEACLNLEHAHFGVTDNLFFEWVQGSALKISSSWENYFKLLNFRHVNALGKGVIVFDSNINSGDNITATSFEKVMFEATLGDLVVVKPNCTFSNSYFGTINIECWALTPTSDYTFTTITDEVREDFVPWSVFNVFARCDVEVNNLELNNFNYRYLTYNDLKYCYNTIVNVGQDNANPNMVINNIVVSGMKLDTPILKQNTFYIDSKSHFAVNNTRLYRTTNKIYFDVAGARSIQCNSNNLKAKNYKDDVYITENTEGLVPFYKVINKFGVAGDVNKFGVLYYDEDSRNELNLVVKPYNGEVGSDSNIQHICANMIITGKNMLIRAKIPEGENATLILYLENGTSQTLYLEGTGEYTDYLKEEISTFVIGASCGLRLATAQVNKTCYLDYYKFY